MEVLRLRPERIHEKKPERNDLSPKSAFIRGKELRPRFECGPGPATPNRICRVFLCCLVTADAAP